MILTEPEVCGIRLNRDGNTAEMSQKRIRNRYTSLPSPPYWRSILVSVVLLLAIMFSFEAISDPRSGAIKSANVVAPALFLLVLAEAAVFYGEFRRRRKRPPARARSRSGMKRGVHAG
jgi:hypothetical protein